MMTGESRNTAFIQASDATLVGAAKQGNSVAFDVLAKRHEAKVIRVLLCITRNRECPRRNATKPSKSLYRTGNIRRAIGLPHMVKRIAINEALMLMRKNRGITSVSLDDASSKRDSTLAQEIPDSAANPEEKYSLHEREKILTLAMKQLPPATQTALLLQLEDHTPRDSRDSGCTSLRRKNQIASRPRKTARAIAGVLRTQLGALPFRHNASGLSGEVFTFTAGFLGTLLGASRSNANSMKDREIT